MFCPKKKGFFPLLYMKLDESLSVEERAQFAALQTPKDRLKFVLNLPRLTSEHEDNLFRIIRPMFGEKSKAASEENRESGNVAFYSGNYRQAQILYSIAVFKAPKAEDGQTLALALANRSACLQKLNSYKLAISDIDLSIESGYPDLKVFKLHERKAECLASLNQFSEAAKSYRRAIQTLSKSSLAKDKRDKLKSVFKSKMDECQSKKDQDEPADGDEGEAATRVLNVPFGNIQEPNPNYPAFHKGVEIRYEEGRGRFAAASEDIPMGTPLVRDVPYTWNLYAEKYGSNCQHCMAVIRAVVPCKYCSWVCFCSVRCRNAALATYHKYECSVTKMLLESGLNIYCFMAYRALCIEGLESLLSMRSDLEGRSELSGQSTENVERNLVYKSNEFRNLYNLVSHERLLDENEWFLRVFVAAFLVKALKQADFFINSKSSLCADIPGMTEDEFYVAEVLLQLINVCPCNSHDISEFETPVTDKFIAANNKVSLGAAIFPSLALLNHSCEADFMRCNVGKGVLCVANRDIKKGDEINENYGYMYTMKSLSERRDVLKKHYKFDCLCQACDEAWPTRAEMKAEMLADLDDENMKRFPRIFCVHCGTALPNQHMTNKPFYPLQTCISCGKDTDLKKDIPLTKIKKLSESSVHKFIRGDWHSGLSEGRKCTELVQTHFGPPVLELAEVHIAMWKCMWLKAGNMKLVKMN